MFLSRLILDSRDPQDRRDLARPYEMHRTLWRAFPDDDPGRVLFRVDTDRVSVF
jgi:CRISPR system Cascade subunit CasE